MSIDPNDGQSVIPFISGSPEGVYFAPPGFLVCDRIACELYQKTTPYTLATGWRQQRGIGTIPISISTGAGNPNGAVPGNVGDVFIQVVSSTEAYQWIKATAGGNTGWI